MPATECSATSYIRDRPGRLLRYRTVLIGSFVREESRAGCSLNRSVLLSFSDAYPPRENDIRFSGRKGEFILNPLSVECREIIFARTKAVCA